MGVDPVPSNAQLMLGMRLIMLIGIVLILLLAFMVLYIRRTRRADA